MEGLSASLSDADERYPYRNIPVIYKNCKDAMQKLEKITYE